MISVNRLIVIPLFLLLLLGSVLATRRATTSTAPADVLDNVRSCEDQLKTAEIAFRAGVKAGELGIFKDGLGGGVEFAKARTALAAAVALTVEKEISKSDPAVAADALGRDAWFAMRIDNRQGDAFREIREALKLNHSDPVLHYKLAAFLAQILRSNYDPDSRVKEKEEAVDEVQEALKLDPEMPEGYRLRAILNAESASGEKECEDYRNFLKYYDSVRPELFIYNTELMLAWKQGAQQYLQSFSSTRASTQPRSQCKWETTEVAVSAGLTDKPAKADFHFSNTGKTAIRISKITPSCGCTTAQLSKDNLNPGESGTLHVEMAIGNEVGRTSRRVVVEERDEDGKTPEAEIICDHPYTIRG